MSVGPLLRLGLAPWQRPDSPLFMTDPTVLAVIYGAFLIGLLSPGPDLVLVTALSLKDGRQPARWAALGIATGVGFWVLAAAAGLSGLMSRSPMIWDGMRLLGGGVLIYLGSRSISAGLRGRPAEADRPMRQMSAGPYVLGLATNLANPKAAVVLVSLVVAMAEQVPARDDLMMQVLGMPVLAGIWFTVVATALSHRAIRERLAEKQRVIDGVVGAALAAVGILLIQAVSPA